MKSEILSDKAYMLLKERIYTLEKGTHIIVRDFAKDINMSYTPVREAFLRLCGEGVLKLIPNVGYFVQKLDLMEMMQIFDTRKCIEPYVLEHSFGLLTDEHFDRIEEYIEEQRQTLVKNDIREYMLADIEIHSVIFEAHNNKYLLDFYQNLREHYLYCSNIIAEKLSTEAIQEHEKLLEFMKNGQKDEAISLMKKHIEDVEQRMKGGYTKLND